MRIRKTVKLVRWGKDGVAVADVLRHDGKQVTVAVREALVGEDVETEELRKVRGGAYETRVCAVQNPSPHRVAPLCPHFGECGGCTWQHIAYEEQLRIKQTFIDDLFASYCTVRPIIGTDIPWRYRNKMEFSFSQDKAGNRFLGLINLRGRVMNVQVCPLTPPWMAEALCCVRTWWERSELRAYHPGKNEGTLQTLTVREGISDRMVMLTVSGNPSFAPKKRQLDELVAMLRELFTPTDGTLSIVLRIRQIAKGMPTQFYEMMLHGPDFIRMKLSVSLAVDTPPVSMEFHVSPQAFFQPNSAQCCAIYSTALTLAELTPSDVVWDLYCGIGGFGMLAASRVSQAVGVEISRESAYDGTTNRDRLQIQNFSIHCGDTGEVIASMKAAGNFLPPTIVIIDPPRAGMSTKALLEIVSLGPEKIVYVSCNPQTQVKDVEALVSHGWHVVAVQPIDQFPQTPHIENIALLRR